METKRTLEIQKTAGRWTCKELTAGPGGVRKDSKGQLYETDERGAVRRVTAAEVPLA